jgi:SAM-dependent methyltransferase
VDLSAEAVRLAHARGAAVARAELMALPFADGTFDCVTSFDVIYHRWVRDDAAAVREMARVLRPGGLLLLRVPALKMLWGAHDEAVHSRHRYTRGEVRRLLAAQGFEVLRATYANSLLFPVLAARRTLDRLTGRQGSDVGFLPAPLERSFAALLRLEAHLVRHLSLPLGASVFALARKR